jgi:UTP-glucose-1-phosphate uridylyltransferase
MSVFGQYILTPEVFDQLRSDIANAADMNKEIELTSALDKVREQTGMIGIQPQGRMYDMGNYHALVNCITNYLK